MRNFKSFRRGLRAMSSVSEFFRHWAIHWHKQSSWWCHFWTPVWHEGRGPYVSIGLGYIAVYRGY